MPLLKKLPLQSNKKGQWVVINTRLPVFLGGGNTAAFYPGSGHFYKNITTSALIKMAVQKWTKYN